MHYVCRRCCEIDMTLSGNEGILAYGEMKVVIIKCNGDPMILCDDLQLSRHVFGQCHTSIVRCSTSDTDPRMVEGGLSAFRDVIRMEVNTHGSLECIRTLITVEDEYAHYCHKTLRGVNMQREVAVIELLPYSASQPSFSPAPFASLHLSGQIYRCRPPYWG